MKEVLQCQLYWLGATRCHRRATRATSLSQQQGIRAGDGLGLRSPFHQTLPRDQTFPGIKPFPWVKPFPWIKPFSWVKPFPGITHFPGITAQHQLCVNRAGKGVCPHPGGIWDTVCDSAAKKESSKGARPSCQAASLCLMNAEELSPAP